MLVISSVPKAGSHAFAAFLSRVGARRCPGTLLGTTPEQQPLISGAPWTALDVLRHLPDNVYIIAHTCAAHAAALADFPVVSVLRDPRNVLISYQRHRKRTDGLDISTAEALADFWSGGPFIDLYRGFLGWHGKAAIVRYEDLPASVTGNGNGIYCQHDRRHNTRTGNPSDWTEHWGCMDHKAWRDAGGLELVAEAGY